MIKVWGILKSIEASLVINKCEIAALTFDIMDNGVPTGGMIPVFKVTACAIRMVAQISALSLNSMAHYLYNQGTNNEMLYGGMKNDLTRLSDAYLNDLTVANSNRGVSDKNSPIVPDIDLTGQSLNIIMKDYEGNVVTDRIAPSIDPTNSSCLIGAGLYYPNDTLVPIPYTLKFEVWENPGEDMDHDAESGEKLCTLGTRSYKDLCYFDTTTWVRKIEGLSRLPNGNYTLKITSPDYSQVQAKTITVTINDSTSNPNGNYNYTSSKKDVGFNFKGPEYNASDNSFLAYMTHLHDGMWDCTAIAVDKNTGQEIEGKVDIELCEWDDQDKDGNEIKGETLYSTRDNMQTRTEDEVEANEDPNRSYWGGLEGLFRWNFGDIFWASENKITIYRHVLEEYKDDPYSEGLDGVYPRPGLTMGWYKVKIIYRGSTEYNPTIKTMGLEIWDDRYRSIEFPQDIADFNYDTKTLITSKTRTDSKYNLKTVYKILKK